ncbi:MAG: hypothetical protein AAGA02_01975, partial [Bacteroidota bacterium]
FENVLLHFAYDLWSFERYKCIGEDSRILNVSMNGRSLAVRGSDVVVIAMSECTSEEAIPT